MSRGADIAVLLDTSTSLWKQRDQVASFDAWNSTVQFTNALIEGVQSKEPTSRIGLISFDNIGTVHTNGYISNVNALVLHDAVNAIDFQPGAPIGTVLVCLRLLFSHLRTDRHIKFSVFLNRVVFFRVDKGDVIF
jgi:hypothetical protein